MRDSLFHRGQWAAFGFGRCKKLTFNDIGSRALAELRKNLLTLPKELQDRCQVIQADCLDLLQKTPKLRNDIDLILCRNLIHFFSDEQLGRFFSLMKELLKPAGKAILNVISVASFLRNSKEMAYELYKNTTFTIHRLDLYYPDKSGKDHIEIVTKALPCPSHKMSDKTEYITLCDKIRISFKPKSVEGSLKKIDSVFSSQIRMSINSKLSVIKKCIGGSLLYIKTNTRAYSFQTLTDLFEKNGFGVETVFDIRPDGHLNHEFFSDSHSTAQMGILISKA
jgi:Methyltransferase domain